MEAALQKRLTASEYLVMERLAETKREFLDGEVFSMAGGTHNHSQVASNCLGSLWSALRGHPCRPLNSDMRLKIEGTGLYAYPDHQVVCGAAQFEDDRLDTLLNPTVIMEFLSPSTAGWDRGQKFWHYRHLESLQQYVLISAEQSLVEVFTRQPNSGWLLDTFEDPSGAVELASVGCKISLADLYLGVEFPPGRLR